MTSKLQNTFVFRLLQRDKLMFACIGLYMLGILYYVSRQREEFPFLLYGMYSLKELPDSTYTAYSITVDGLDIRYAKLRDAQRELIASTLEHAVPLIESGKMDTADEVKFKSWLMKYCLDMRMSGDSKMSVFKLTCNYDE